MNFLAILLFSASATCDSLIIGLSYGARKIKICFTSNLIVGLISCLGTMLGMYIGNIFNGFLIGSITQWRGSALLFLFGFYMFYQALYKQVKANSDVKIINDAADLAENFDKDHSKSIDIREACMLGLFLCLNLLVFGLLRLLFCLRLRIVLLLIVF